MTPQRQQSKASVTGPMNLLGALAAFGIAIAIPLGYYGLSISEMRNSLTVETVFIAKSIEKTIQAQPEMWEFEYIRLLEIASQRTIAGKQGERIIRNAAGRPVVETAYRAVRPVIATTVTLFDSGRPVGSIEARHSVRTSILFTALLGIFSSLFGYLLFFIFRTYPMKKLERTLADLRQAEEEQRRHRDMAEQLAREMALLAEIGRIIGSTLDIEEVYERFAAEARKLIPFDNLIINLIHREENALLIAFASGMDIPSRRQGDRIPFQGSVSEVLAQDRNGVLFQSEHLEEMLRKFPTLVHLQQAGLRATMLAPLISGDKVIGALVFRSREAAAYNEHSLHLAERIGMQIAEAISNAELFENLKKAESSLRTSEGRFRTLVEQAAVGVAEIEMETGRFLTVNRRLCEMVARTEAELLSTTLQAITPPEDQHLHDAQSALLLAGKIGHYSLEKRCTRKDGALIWVNVTVSPLWKPGGQPGRNMIVVEDISKRKRMEEALRELSLRDQLTDLYNRRGFITLAEQQLKGAGRARRSLLLTFIDCDHLKRINDTLGHEEGDRALLDTANLLRQAFRESDIIARLGGDEFAVLSIDTADAGHEDFTQRLEKHIAEFNSTLSRPYRLSLSWGTAIYDPRSPLSLDQLLSAADGLMYTQKKTKLSQET